MSGKKVVLFIVDSLMSTPLHSFIRTGKAPALQYLIEKGNLYEDFISSFPTMSVTISSTLLTGTYADQHHVPALVWYYHKECRLIDLGSSKNAFLTMGPKRLITKAIHDLNHLYLNNNIQTIHEQLANKNISTGSFNELLFRGHKPNKITFPKWLASLGLTPKSLQVKTPHLFTYGLLKKLPNLKAPLSTWKRVGFNNQLAIDTITNLMKENKMPDFSIVYLPDLDQTVHKHGPSTTRGLAQLEEQMTKILDSMGTWGETLKHYTLILIGDSGQDHLHEAIDLKTLLKPFNILPPYKTYTGRKQIAIGHNERMAYVYPLHEDISIPELVKQVKMEQRVDLIVWKEKGRVWVQQGGQHEGYLCFKKGGRYQDRYQQSWDIDGDLSILDLTITPSSDDIKITLNYNSYPDALSRLYGACYSHPEEFIIITSKPGTEFKLKYFPTHLGGGAHGSLHKADSLFPLIICGTNLRPQSNRLVDFKDFLLELLLSNQ